MADLRLLCSLLPLWLAFGCKEEDATLEYQPEPVLDANACDVPDVPALGGEAQVVGDGSAESCTVALLRDALSRGGQISFDCGTEPFTFAIDETLNVLDGTTLDGGGSITLDGGGTVRILSTEAHSNVLVEGVTFANGHATSRAGDDGASGANGSGGAIHRGWQSHLDLRDCVFLDNVADGDQGFGGGAIATDSSGWTTIVGCTFSGNRSALGGAIHSMLSDLIVVDSDFDSNISDTDGGAIFTDGAHTAQGDKPGSVGGTITLCGSTFVDNEAKSSSGAGFLYAYGIDQLRVNRCEFRSNLVTSADPGLGGALRIDADAYVRNSLFVDNETQGQGGAVWLGRGPVRFENVTFFDNRAALWGGALSYAEVSTSLHNCTLAQNAAGESCGALFGGAGAVTANNTLFVNNTGGAGANATCRNPLSGKNNLLWPVTKDDACGDEPSFVHKDPLLSTELADEGGATMTLALGEASPAIDAGTDCPATDQRGQARDATVCDIGAFER